MIYLVDIDGTVADLSHRLHFIQGEKANWDGFFAACPNDMPINEVIETVRLLKNGGAKIVLVSGRSDAIRTETAQWCANFGVSFDGLYMRKAGDHRHDNIVKSELLDAVLIDFPGEQIAGAFEDRKQVVDMYRERGLRVFQVAEGNF